MGHTSSGDRRVNSGDFSGNKRAAPPPLGGRKTVSPLGGGLLDSQPATQKVRPTDPKAALKYDIEQERHRIKKMEDSYREELDTLRRQEQRAIGEAEADHITAKRAIDAEKQRIENDKNAAIEAEKRKLVQLNKIEAESREL